MTSSDPKRESVDAIKIGNPDKLMYPDAGITKQDVAAYFEKIADTLLPHIKGRPLTMRRYPDGIGKDGFYNKHAPDYFPDFIARLSVPQREKGGETMEMVSADSAADLVYFADQAALELHMGLSTTDDLETPDQIIFDLDPSDDDFEKVRKTALALKDLLENKGWTPFVKTSGSRGLHIHVALKPQQKFENVKPKTKDIAQELVDKIPDITTLEQRKNKRGDKVFIDYLRNDYGMTAIAPYCLRGKPGAPVATPLDWDELKDSDLTPQTYTLENIFRRLAQKNDPWTNFHRHGVVL